MKRRTEVAPHPGYQPLWVVVKLAPGYTFEVGLLMTRLLRSLLVRITSTGRSLRITGHRSLTKDSSKMKIETFCKREKKYKNIHSTQLTKIVSISIVACCLVQLCTTIKWTKLQIIKFIALNLLSRSGQFTTDRTGVQTIAHKILIMSCLSLCSYCGNVIQPNREVGEHQFVHKLLRHKILPGEYQYIFRI